MVNTRQYSLKMDSILLYYSMMLICFLLIALFAINKDVEQIFL